MGWTVLSRTPTLSGRLSIGGRNSKVVDYTAAVPQTRSERILFRT
jgi:hypothetical protein